MSSPQHNTMESLLERGEKIDDLVSKSEVLGVHSKAFYKTVGATGWGRAPLPASGQRAVTGGPPRLAPPSECSEMGGKAKGPWLVHGGTARAEAGGSLSLPLPLPHGRLASAWAHPLAPALCPALDTAFFRVLTALRVAPPHSRLSCPSVACRWDSVSPHTFTSEGGGQWGGVI